MRFLIIIASEFLNCVFVQQTATTYGLNSFVYILSDDKMTEDRLLPLVKFSVDSINYFVSLIFFSAGNKERFQRLWNPCRPTSSQPGVRLHDVRRHHQSIQSYWTRFKCLSFSKNEFRNHNTFPTRSRAIRRHGEVGFTFVKTSGWSSGGKWNRLL